LSSVADFVPIAPAPSGRSTALHYAASEGYTESAVALLVGGADQSITNSGYAG
jgi:ankyrin repeat protein